MKMRPCDDCENWAQWLMRSPIYGIDPLDKESKKVVIVAWKHIAHLCDHHKQLMQSIQRELELHFTFMGATIGTSHPQP